jgi:phosphoribosylformylglycinamidine cyclo-ligase
VFELVRSTGAIARADLEVTFNLGVGMVAVLPADRVADALTLLAHRDVPAWTIGEIAVGDAHTGVEVVAEYAGNASTWR